MANRFKPWSVEREIPNTDCTIQVGDINGKWAVVIRKKLNDGNKKALALKKIQKLTDTNIINVIKDTIGKQYSLDTFTLGSTMSVILREVYDKIKSHGESKATPQTEKTLKQPATTQSNVKPISSIPTPKKREADSFWSSYDTASSYTYPQNNVPPQQPVSDSTTSLQPSQTQQYIPQATSQPPETTPDSDESSDLDAILGDLGLSCPYCGAEIGPDDEICPRCGKKIPL